MRNLRGTVVLTTVLGVLGLPAALHAAPGSPGTPPASSTPFSSASGLVEFGSFSFETTTTPNGDEGAPAGCGTAEGASAFAFDLGEPARLDLTATELDADGLCAIALYRSTVTSFYDVAARAEDTILETICTVTCTLGSRLDAGRTYLVVWPRGNGNVSRDVQLAGSLRGFPDITGQLTGRDVGSCRRIDRDERTTVRFDVAPTPSDPADQVVTLSRVDRRTGEVTDLGTRTLDGNGAGSLTFGNVLRGYHDVVVAFDGSDTHTQRQLRLCLVVRGPSKLQIRVRGERYRYDDYAVYRDGDRMTFRLPVFPWPPGANGELSVRIERNIGNHRYMPWEVRRGIQVRDGLAVLRMKAIYRSNGLPFYRMRTEWAGSNTHAPGMSPWICYQVDP